MNRFYDHSVFDQDGNEVSMRSFEGKVVMIVNTATGCGFTPQYKQLEEMYEKYHDKGLEIIDIPCNQFGHQAPGTDQEITQFCTLRYNTKFPQMRKSDVNGENALPLYTFLKGEKKFDGFGRGAAALAMSAMLKAKNKDYASDPDIKWNFTKFVVDREGTVVARFEPTNSMEDLDECVRSLLG